MAPEEIALYGKPMKADIDQLKIGDEIEFNSASGHGRRFVITEIYNGFVSGIGANGSMFSDKNPRKWHKTGNFYPEAVALMNAIEERMYHTGYFNKEKELEDNGNQRNVYISE